MASHSHKSYTKEIDLKLTDVFVEDIFPTKIYSAFLDVNNDEIINECYKLRNDNPEGVKYSNYNGWQSNPKTGQDPENWSSYPNISELAAKMVMFANDACGSEDLDIEFPNSHVTWWVNINDQFSYNVFHAHPKTDIIGVYYPKINETTPQGEITLVRTDGSLNHELYNSRSDYTYFQIKAEQSRAYLFPAHLLHFVSPNQTNEDRISISFNIFTSAGPPGH